MRSLRRIVLSPRSAGEREPEAVKHHGPGGHRSYPKCKQHALEPIAQTSHGMFPASLHDERGTSSTSAHHAES